jgi:flavodoxin I
METLIVFDSKYGNTEKIAKAIYDAVNGNVRVIRASIANPAELGAVDLLIVGSPINGGRPTPAIQGFLDGLTEFSVKGKKVAAFDTRFSKRWVKVFGFAADKILDNLKSKGGIIASSPEGFFVKGTKGPLKEGELERAAGWAKEIFKTPYYHKLGVPGQP